MITITTIFSIRYFFYYSTIGQAILPPTRLAIYMDSKVP